MLPYNRKLKSQSRNLRKRMTNAEILLWSKLRRKQLKNCQFYRQKPIGNYIVDFYCPKAELVIEIDGGQHYYGEQLKKDDIRDEYLKNESLKVLRFSDWEVFKNTNAVLERIYENLSVSLTIPLSPPFSKGEAQPDVSSNLQSEKAELQLFNADLAEHDLSQRNGSEGNPPLKKGD